jgi:hypothetical protein
MKSPWKMLKLNNRYVELNRVDAWLDQPVSRAGKVFLGIMAVLVAVSVLMMIAKWI